MSRENFSTTKYSVYNQTHEPPKKTLSGGEEISKGDLTIPPILTKIWKLQKVKSPTKINPTIPSK